MESVLNRVRRLWYDWKTQRVFLFSHVVGAPADQETFNTEAELEAFLSRHFLFFSYRRDFTPLLSTEGDVTADTGWGCLVRSTQMLLAHCLKRHALHTAPLTLFRDIADTRAAPFSVRALVGHSYAKRPFTTAYWSPSQGCEALQCAVEQAVYEGSLPSHVAAVSSVCGTLFTDEVETRLAGRHDSGVSPSPPAFAAAASASAAPSLGTVLIMLPVRVSVRAEMDQVSFECVSQLMQLSTCVGVVGGTPGRSFYLIGCCQHQVIYLDPHLEVQSALVDCVAPGHVIPTLQHLKAVPFWKLCTSLFIAFVVRTRSEWTQLRQRLARVPFVNVEDGGRPRSLRRLAPHSPDIAPASEPSSGEESDGSARWLAI